MFIRLAVATIRSSRAPGPVSKTLFQRPFSITLSKMSEGWNPNLTAEQLKVLRDKHTERPHTGAYLNSKESGIYHCANCDSPLYKSDTKFDSQCGWPSFYEEVKKGAITYHKDKSMFTERTEICCSNCGGHLGHVFEGEGWKERLGLPQDVRHCVNSLSLNLKKKE
ncbi:LANO_0G01178g1_1 [Lachancea nothofagi CBS 11611]|uniref:Peptide-methionine (R)-S-oxide reductase n=1 Tax=Lachancea nothofagi CBS 11611 TaxID=1266666 RepID=A0A1G4KEQ6_9SACH|nr:LANO_0G01178g1_1 [Lachancea nothofagi CBS 11611]